MKTSGQRIKEKRHAANMNQKALAKAVGVTGATISQWESGATSPRGDRLTHLARLLHTTPDWIVYGVDAKEFDDQGGMLIHSDHETICGLLSTLTEIIAKTDPEVRKEVVHLATRYLENPGSGDKIARAIEALLSQEE